MNDDQPIATSIKVMPVAKHCAACDRLIDLSVCPHCRMPIVPQE